MNSSVLPISDFMMVKEDNKSQRRSIFSSMYENADDKEEICSLSSNSSKESNNENINYKNVSNVENRLESSFQRVLIDTKPKSQNRQRRKSFLTGKHDSSFAASPFHVRRSEVAEKSYRASNSPDNHTNVTAKDISEQEDYNYYRRKQSSNQPNDNNIESVTRIHSKGSDMSLTLVASQEEDSCPMFTEAFTQIIEESSKTESSNEVAMDDVDDVLFGAVTKQHPDDLKLNDIGSDEDSGSMFSQRETQFSLSENYKESPKDSVTSLSPQNEAKSKAYKQPSFQNFSSGSAKAAIESLTNGLESDPKCLNQRTESDILLTNRQNKEQVLGSSENSSEICENPLEINEEEELAVSIMTQAFSEALSEGKGEQSPGAKSDHQNVDEANEHLPATQPSFNILLEGVVAYVEVRTANENRSACVKSRLESIGAKVSEALNLSCTHLVFKDGSLSTYNKAKKMGLHIVSVSWIEACRNECSKLPEANFPCSNRERYEDPGLFPKLRKAKSMQPKPEEEFIRALNMRISRKEKAKQRTEEKIKAAQKAEKERLYNPFTYRVRHPFPDNYYNSPTNPANLSSMKPSGIRHNVLDMLKEYDSCIAPENVMSPTFIEFTSPSERCAMDCSKSVNEGKCHIPETPSPCKSDDLNTPLLKRVTERINRKNSISHSAIKVTSNGHSNSKNCPRNASPNSSPIVGKSNFEIRSNAEDQMMTNKTMNSDLNLNKVNDSAIHIKSKSENPQSIVRTRSGTRKSLITNSLRRNSSVSNTSKKKIDSKKQLKNDLSSKTHTNLSIAYSPLKIPKSIVRTRSDASNSTVSKLNASCNEVTGVAKEKIPKTKKGFQKKRRILFSDQSSLLAESPTGLTQEINWKVPSPPKTISKSNKKSAPPAALKSTTKLVRSESGSLLYAEPPKSNVAHNSRPKRPNRYNANGSYRKAEVDNFGSDNINDVQKKTGVKRTILPSRRSTAEFQSPSISVTGKRTSSKINLVPIAEEISFTSCSKEDIDLARQLANTYKLTEKVSSQASTQSSNSSGSRITHSKAKPRAIKVAINGKVSNETTHLVCGDSSEVKTLSQDSSNSQQSQCPKIRRTINLLKGILHGCWILSVNWLYDSLELGHWADEEMYELVDFSPAVKRMRLEKEAFFSPSYGIRFSSVSIFP